MNLQPILLRIYDFILRIPDVFLYISFFILIFGVLLRTYGLKNYESKTMPWYYVDRIITYYISVLLVIQLAECFYYLINKYSCVGVLKTLIDCGVLLSTLLVSSGRMIDCLYKFFMKNAPKQIKDLEFNTVEKTYIICWSSVATIITSFIFNYYLWVYALAIFLSRFIWFDTKKTLLEAFGEMNDKNSNIRYSNIVKIRTMLLLGCLLYTMIILILRFGFNYSTGYIQ